MKLISKEAEIKLGKKILLNEKLANYSWFNTGGHASAINFLISRGFDPQARNIRDSMKDIYNNFPAPSKENTVKKIKNEEYFNVTTALETWRNTRNT